jgi:hypothetical protein
MRAAAVQVDADRIHACASSGPNSSCARYRPGHRSVRRPAPSWHQGRARVPVPPAGISKATRGMRASPVLTCSGATAEPNAAKTTKVLDVRRRGDRRLRARPDPLRCRASSLRRARARRYAMARGLLRRRRTRRGTGSQSVRRTDSGREASYPASDEPPHRCEEEKPPTEFSRDRSRKDRRYP